MEKDAIRHLLLEGKEDIMPMYQRKCGTLPDIRKMVRMEESGLNEQAQKYQPKRAQERPVKAKKPGVLQIIAAVVVLALVLVGYVILCNWVNTEQIMSKTTVNGVDLSGMTQDQAEAALEEDFQKRYSQAKLTVSANGDEYTVELGNALGLDCGELAQKALAPSQAQFLTRGFSYMKAALVGRKLNVMPEVGDPETLHQDIVDSGLLEIDTTVQTSYEIKDEQLVFTIGTTGSSVDEEVLTEQINAAVQADNYEKTLECPMVTGTVEPVNVNKVYQEVYKDPANATLDPQNDYEIVEAVTGVSFDKEEAAAALEGAEEGSQVKVALSYKEPEITTQNLEENLFKDRLATYTTKVGGTADRKSNVRLAAEKCNGVILLNGDVFSYNEVVGERTAANGFKPAAAYLNGETVQEYGGGICQVSSTLYAATLYANLEIVQRQNHTYASSYIGLGLDATVSWGGPDFQFSNNRAYPIKIESSYYDGYMTVNIWGTKTDDTTVEIVSETLETIPYETEYKNDSSQYVGESTVVQSGEDGYKVQTYRQIYDGDGNLISNEKEAYSVYSKHNQIIYQGTKEKPKTTTKKNTDTNANTNTNTNTDTSTDASTSANAGTNASEDANTAATTNTGSGESAAGTDNSTAQ